MATPTYATALSQINTFIVANGNNEITANVLNPVLKVILDFANNNIGDLTTLTTDETNTIVEAINSLKQNFEDLINNGVQLHTGYDDPNLTPPADYNYGDFYMQLDSGDDSPIQLWQWNGFEWKDSSSNPATNSDNVENNSDVVGQTVTDALNNLLNSLPNEYTKVVYVNNNNPNSATIFDLNNPPTVNDNLLKSDVNNLYIGLDASTWVYNATSLNYVTKTITSATSNFYLSGTTTDAGNSKTAYIERSGTVKIPFFINERMGVGGSFGSTIKIRLTGDLSGGTTSTGILNESTVQSGVTSNAYYNRTFAGTQAASFNLPNLTHYMASQSAFGAGSSVTNQIGFHASNTLTGATNNYGFKGELSSSANNWNLYLDGTAQNYLNGNLGIKTASPVGVLDVNTGLSGMTPTYSTIPLGTFVFGNFSTLNTVPTIYSKSNTSIGMAFVGGTNDTNSEDMRFEVRENDGSDFATLTSIGFKFRRFNTTLLDIYRNGNATLLGALTANGALLSGETASTIASFDASKNVKSLPLATYPSLAELAFVKGVTSAVQTQLNAKANLAGTQTFTGIHNFPTPTAGTNTTQVSTTAFVTGAISTADAGNVKLTGSQTISGGKTFVRSISGDSPNIIINNIVGGYGATIDNNSSGGGISSTNSGLGTGIQVTNSAVAPGTGMSIANTSTGNGVSITNQSSGTGLRITNSGSSTGPAIVIQDGSSATGNLISGINNFSVEVFFVNKEGNIKATIPVYANDAAADADATLLAGSFYKITGSRAVMQKP